MNVCMDARLLMAGGIGRYIREIVSRALLDPRISRVTLLGSEDVVAGWLSGRDPRDIASVVHWGGRPYSLTSHLSWPVVASKVPSPDVWFFPHYDVPMMSIPSPLVVTVHDVIQFRHPAGFPGWKRFLGMALLRSAVSHASSVVTVSHASANALAQVVPDVVRRMHVVHNGVSSRFAPLAPGEEMPSRFADLSPFLLTVGAPTAHKNLTVALEVLARLSDSFPDLRLCMVGFDAHDAGELNEHALRLGILDRVMHLGRVTDAELHELYLRCSVFLSPSTTEGFGLPALEAFACGSPVIVSDIPAFREILPPETLRVEPLNVALWAETVRHVLQRGAEGPGRPVADASSSWDQSAEGTLRVLLDAARVQ